MLFAISTNNTAGHEAYWLLITDVKNVLNIKMFSIVPYYNFLLAQRLDPWANITSTFVKVADL